MRTATKIGLGAAALTGAGVVASQVLFGRGRYEGPHYTVVEESDPFELRRYEPRIVAETEVVGSYEDASNEGFRRLARFIFGDNAGHSAVAMTTPVDVRPRERIAMTTPVDAAPGEGGWVIAFTMPARYSRQTLPLPNDGRIRIREEPARLLAAARFDGRASERRTKQMEDGLRDWLALRGLAPAGGFILSRYDPPWTLPFLRRNEVLVPVQESRAVLQ